MQRDSIQIEEREKGEAKPLKLARKRNPVIGESGMIIKRGMEKRCDKERERLRNPIQIFAGFDETLSNVGENDAMFFGR